MLNIDNKFDIGQVVYLKTDSEQSQRLCVGIYVSKCELLYEVILGTTVSRHFDFEISETADVLKSI